MADQTEQPKQISLNDVGTRYDHLMDLKSAVDIVIERLKEREIINPVDAQKLFEFSVMSRGIQTAMDSMAGLNGYMEEYKMYQLLNSIPDDPSKIEGGRGTPLNDTSFSRNNKG